MTFYRQLLFNIVAAAVFCAASHSLLLMVYMKLIKAAACIRSAAESLACVRLVFPNGCFPPTAPPAQLELHGGPAPLFRPALNGHL